MPPPPPPPPTIVAANSHWLAFRCKHDTELQEFQQEVRERRITLEQNVQKARAVLLARHKREEEEFWRGLHGGTGKSDARSGGDSSTKDKASSVGRDLQPTKAKVKAKATKEKEKDAGAVMGKNERVEHQSPRSLGKKAVVTYIDLCSDENEDEDDMVVMQDLSTKTASSEPQPNNTKQLPALAPYTDTGTPRPQSSNAVALVETREEKSYAIPSASLELFGNKPKTFGHRFAAFQASTAQLMQCSAPGLNGTAFKPRSLSSSTPTTLTIPVHQRCGFQEHPSLASGLFPIVNPAPRPQHNAVNQRTQSTALEQLLFNGLPLERSHVSASDEPPSTPKLQQYAPNMLQSPSITEPSTPTTPSTPSFRKPMFPASATKDAVPAARNVRESSKASTSIIQTSCPARSQRNLSVACRVSSSSRTTTTKGGKRNVLDISSDEDDSDEYAPDPSDDEEELESHSEVFRDRKAAKHDVRELKSGPVWKKAKTALALNGETKTGKNSFGFQAPSQSKPKVSIQPVPWPPKTPMRPSSHKPQPNTPRTPALIARKPTKAMPAIRPGLLPRSSQRSSKVATKSRIAEQLAFDEEYLTVESTSESDAEEMPEREAIKDMRSGLRSMSLTPASGDTNTVGTTGYVASLADVSGVHVSESMGVAKRSGCKGDKGWDSWIRKRAGGDRYLAKMGEEGSDGDGSEDECERYGMRKG